MHNEGDRNVITSKAYDSCYSHPKQTSLRRTTRENARLLAGSELSLGRTNLSLR